MEKMNVRIAEAAFDAMKERSQEQFFFETLAHCKETNNWEDIALIGNTGRWSSVNALSLCINSIPRDERLYDLIIKVYVNNGYHFPKKLIKEAKKVKPSDYLKELPLELAETDPITVYRCSATAPVDIEFVHNEISWTTNIETAEWFYNRELLLKHEAYIYEATITKKQIIAYTNDRNEFEVIQYRGIKNPKLLRQWDKE